MKKMIAILICIAVLASLSSCRSGDTVGTHLYHLDDIYALLEEYQKDIDIIYFAHWPVFRTHENTTAYKIDLKLNAFSKIESGAEYSQKGWGSETGDADFKFVSALKNDDIDRFFRESARFGFTNWEKSYVDENILDGSEWYIKIVFSGGTTQAMSGTNKYPETWGDMMGAFEALTHAEFKAGG